MVPLFAAAAQRLAHRVPVGWVAAAGSAAFGIGTVMLLFALGPHPSYLKDALPGWLLCGAGVGLTIPTVLSAATADLPATRAATGSGVVNMSRQLGSVLGVSILVVLLTAEPTYAATHAVFVHARWAIAGMTVIGIATSFGMTPRLGASPAPPAETV